MATDAQSLITATVCYDCYLPQYRMLKLALLRLKLLALNPVADTTPATLISQANCYNCYDPEYRMLVLGLLRAIALAANPGAAVDSQSLINSVACYDCYGSAPLLELGLLKVIAGG